MAPFTIIDSTAAVSTNHGAAVIVRTPARARVGLHLFAAVAWPAASAPAAFDGWDTLATVAGATQGSVALLRRACSDAEPATYEFDFAGALAANAPPPMVVLFVATGAADPGLARASGVAEVALGAGPVFTAPSEATVAYSDALVNVFFALGGTGFQALATAVISLSGSDTDAGDVARPGSILLSWEQLELVGATGPRAATSNDAPTAGLAATFIVPAAPALAVPRWDLDTPIGIGLPLVGV